MQRNPHVWYVPGQPNIYATCNAEGICDYSGDGPNEMRARYPDAILTTLDDAMPLIEQAEAECYITAPVEISEAQYYEAFEQLPPIMWKHVGNVEIWRMMEATCGNIRAIYACMGDRYFCLSDRDTVSAAEIAARVRAFAKGKPNK